MNLDPVSIALALVLSSFGFLVFLLWNKKNELNMIEERVNPAAKETQDALIKNFLSFGEIPSKSKLISIITSVARKHQVQLMNYLPIPNIIDNLVYYVISNDLLDPYRKKEISDSLIELKMEPISSEDHVQIYSELEESGSWRQKLVYGQLIKVLVISSSILVTLGILSTQLKERLGSQISYLLNWLLITTIGFCVLLAFFTLFTVITGLYSGDKNKNSSDKTERGKSPYGQEPSSYQNVEAASSFLSTNNIQNSAISKRNNISNLANPANMTPISDYSSPEREPKKNSSNASKVVANQKKKIIDNSSSNKSADNTFEVI